MTYIHVYYNGTGIAIAMGIYTTSFNFTMQPFRAWAGHYIVKCAVTILSVKGLSMYSISLIHPPPNKDTWHSKTEIQLPVVIY